MEKNITKCTARIRRVFGRDLPSHALILGSGFEPVTRKMRVLKEISFGTLPGFPIPGIPGHSGRLLLAELAKHLFLVCCGRVHYYEGLPMETVMFPTQVLAAAGIEQLVLTNAAGGINPKFKPGDLMLFSDHINFMGVNPLRGLPTTGGRSFVDLSRAYSPKLTGQLLGAARQANLVLHRGVYLGVSGPSYETPAEIRAFRKLGADAVGMSTIPEVLMARYSGMEVAAISCITNAAAGMTARPLCHEEVLAVGRDSAQMAVRLLTTFAEGLNTG